MKKFLAAITAVGFLTTGAAMAATSSSPAPSAKPMAKSTAKPMTKSTAKPSSKPQ